MYSFKNENIIEEIECGNNFAYVLNDNMNFVNTDYKVLQSQNDDIFIKCMKLKYNGKIEMFYLTDDYRPLSSMLNGIQADTLITVILNVFAAIIEVQNNGFLSCLNIDMTWDKIFVNSSTLKVRLVYVPINNRKGNSYAEFESELRSDLIKLITRVVQNTTPRLDQMLLDLSNGTLTIIDLYNKSKEVGMETKNSIQQNIFDRHIDIYSNSLNSSQTEILKLVSINAPRPIEIVLDRDVMLLGKKQELVDVAITFNNMISRKHCRIERRNGSYCIADEKSANGTYVNGYKLQPEQMYQINRGDIIRMADSDFQLV